MHEQDRAQAGPKVSLKNLNALKAFSGWLFNNVSNSRLAAAVGMPTGVPPANFHCFDYWTERVSSDAYLSLGEDLCSDFSTFQIHSLMHSFSTQSLEVVVIF